MVDILKISKISKISLIYIIDIFVPTLVEHALHSLLWRTYFNMFRFQTPTVIWQQDGTWTSVVAPLLQKFCPVHLFVGYRCWKHLTWIFHTSARPHWYRHYVLDLSVRPSVSASVPFVRPCVRPFHQTCERDILKTNESKLMSVGTSGLRHEMVN